MARTETPMTMNNVTVSFFSLADVPRCWGLRALLFRVRVRVLHVDCDVFILRNIICTEFWNNSLESFAEGNMF